MDLRRKIEGAEAAFEVFLAAKISWDKAWAEYRRMADAPVKAYT